MLSVVLASILAANFVNHPGAISVVHTCPLQVTKATLEAGKGLDSDSLYANFFIINPTDREFLYTYKLQLRSKNNHSDVREQVGSNSILPHSQGWYREFVGVDFSQPGKYALDQTIVSCASTGG